MPGGIFCLGDPVSLTSVIYWPELGEVYLQPATNGLLLFFVLIKKSEELQGEFIDKTTVGWGLQINSWCRASQWLPKLSQLEF